MYFGRRRSRTGKRRTGSRSVRSQGAKSVQIVSSFNLHFSSADRVEFPNCERCSAKIFFTMLKVLSGAAYELGIVSSAFVSASRRANGKMHVMAQFLPKAASGLAERARSLGTNLLRNRSLDDTSQCKTSTQGKKSPAAQLDHTASVDVHGYANPLGRDPQVSRVDNTPKDCAPRAARGSSLSSDLTSMEGQQHTTDQKKVLTNLRKVKLISQPKGTILYSVS
ncbi:hypothetical protein LSAT2_032223 [Lamellibrachia satsuma]|nr:hypothetical protein LSAT2_032223 [Lamellibrachia satsuma]